MTENRFSCYHCGITARLVDAVKATVAGEELAFCCHGCLNAFRLIQGAGLGAFYERRTAEGGGVAGGAYRTSFDDRDLTRHVYGHQGRSAIDLLIDGIRCATCVWLNERMVA